MIWGVRTAVITTLFLLGSCVSHTSRPISPSFGDVTLTVYNESGGAVDVYTSQRKVGTAMPGVECIVLEESDMDSMGADYLVLDPTSEPAFSTVRAQLYTGNWRVTISAFPNKRAWDRESLRPAPACDG